MRLAIDRASESNASRRGAGFPLGSFAPSIFAELVFVISAPARLTEKGQLAVS